MNAPRSTQELAALFDLPAPERYTLFVTEVLEHGQVWTLCAEDGFVAFSDEDDTDCFPFWPAPELAAALADDDWADCRPEALALDIFMERWLPGMDRDERLVSVFAAPDGSGMVVDPLELLADLEAARSARD
ncbi:DUF2750 domain-containing protein [Marichromatium gracile]|uniref:DUF2750 domain-containing protein n=1 Tax=Marichromatium gracile TaxID=1048 RepID=A0ABR5VFJ7_MARGR|nr:DUF2750 domain-containing protein [Marichromatium gracile]KXX64244.1 hypothetical protein AY586_14410 [Marichromatium gracile]